MELLASPKGNPEFEEFVQLNGTRLTRTAILLTGDPRVAEDLVQTALLATFTHWPRAKVSPDAYSTRVLVNLCRDRWRRERKRGQRSVSERMYEHLRRVRGSSEFGDHVDTLVIRSLMVGAIRSLPDRQREVVVMRFYLDYSVPAIAELLGIPEGTVKSSLNRAVGRLREILRPETFSQAYGGR